MNAKALQIAAKLAEIRALMAEIEADNAATVAPDLKRNIAGSVGEIRSALKGIDNNVDYLCDRTARASK